MNQLVKVILTGTLILCFLSMPSLFYRVSNYVLFVGFVGLAYDAYRRKDQVDLNIFAILFLLYNPFFIVPLPHFIWLIVNTAVVIGMILNILFAEDNPYEDFPNKDDQ
ncbi:MAG: hypothetical protein L6262_08385 [Weeksellaceae bacterium]|nr:hypothetical protein [Weeksellaceae bacterium]